MKKDWNSEPELRNLLLEYRSILDGVEYWGDEQVKATIAKVQKDLEVQEFLLKIKCCFWRSIF
ncbi:MAG: hypothetical protein IPI30_06755 [Saprospiraceae bacterium]|nr:hypothetical protein [Candidatus Vicinibacter affinis]